MARPGNIVADKYRLERMLGRGGMGSVWLARHLELDAPVAVKLLDACRNPAARARFEREARSAAQIRTPHVAQIHDRGVAEGVPYIVMEYLEGEDLGTRLHREGRLSLQAAASLATQVARALRLAHEVGIVHRDLKPSNVFLARTRDDEEVAKVLDFGIAKQIVPGLCEEITATGVLLGTLRYMSPEQLRDPKSADARSDLWSLAVILFLAVTGRDPFAGAALGESVVKICSDPIPRVSDVLPGLPPALDAFFDRALSRDPAQRFQTARELAMTFEVIVYEAAGGAAPYPPPSSRFPVCARPSTREDDEDDAVPTRLLAAQQWVGSSTSAAPASPWSMSGDGSRGQTALLPCVPAPVSSLTPQPWTASSSSWTPPPGSLAVATRPTLTSFGVTSPPPDGSSCPHRTSESARPSRSRRWAVVLTAMSFLGLATAAFWHRSHGQGWPSPHDTHASSAPTTAPAPTSLVPEPPEARTPPPSAAPSAAPTTAPAASAVARPRHAPSPATSRPQGERPDQTSRPQGERPDQPSAQPTPPLDAKPVRVITSAL